MAKKTDKPIPSFLEEHIDKTANEEIREILEFLGRSHSEGQVRGDHLSKILMYLHMQKTEEYKKTLAKLSLLCGIGQRYVKENYLDGLEAFGIIEVQYGSKWRVWKWRGLRKERED